MITRRQPAIPRRVDPLPAKAPAVSGPAWWVGLYREDFKREYAERAGKQADWKSGGYVRRNLRPLEVGDNARRDGPAESGAEPDAHPDRAEVKRNG